MSEKLHPLFPSMAAEHYLDAAALYLDLGEREAADNLVVRVRPLVMDSHGCGEHLLGRLFRLEAELRK